MRICLRRREFIVGLGGAVAWPLAAPGENQATEAAAVGCVLLPRFSAATDSARRFR
jgi:hypothetical protein